MIEGFLTTNEASERFGLSAAHIRRLLEHGTIKGVKAGRDWLARVDSLQTYIQNRPRPGRKPQQPQPRGRYEDEEDLPIIDTPPHY